jgi:hypothetical protein
VKEDAQGKALSVDEGTLARKRPQTPQAPSSRMITTAYRRVVRHDSLPVYSSRCESLMWTKDPVLQPGTRIDDGHVAGLARVLIRIPCRISALSDFKNGEAET